METKIPKGKKIREISPIKSSKDYLHSNNKETIDTNKSTNYQSTNRLSNHSLIKTTKNTNLITTNIKPKIPKNINEYKHLMNNFQLSQADLDWTLDLRTYMDSKTHRMNQTNFNPPSFYETDLNKYKRRSRMGVSDPFLVKENTFQLSHLVKHRIDCSQLDFESTLRSFKMPTGVKTVKHLATWKSIAYTPKTDRSEYFLPPVIQCDKENLKRMDKYVLRKYIPTYVQSYCGTQQIKRKKMILDNNSTLDYFGDHLSMNKYSQHYDVNNIQSIRHILSDHSNSMSQFEIGLREGYEQTTKTEGNKKRMNKINTYKLKIKKTN